MLCFFRSLRCCQHSLKCCNRSAVYAVIWRRVAVVGFRPKIFKILPVRQYRISCILSQSVHNNRFIECYLVPDYQEVVKYILEFAMLISTTARRSTDESIITYRVASFQILRVRQSRISWFRVNTDRKTELSCAVLKIFVLRRRKFGFFYLYLLEIYCRTRSILKILLSRL